MTRQNQTMRNSCNKPQTTIEAFNDAYGTLANVCYIPEKFKKGFLSFIKKSGIPANQMPTNLRVLQRKIDIDARLKHTIQEIYKVLDLHDFSK